MNGRKTQAERQHHIDEHCLEPWMRVTWRGTPATYVGTTAQSMSKIRVVVERRPRLVCPTTLAVDLSDYKDEMQRIVEKRLPM